MLITHRKLDQPRTGRRILIFRRTQNESYSPERRSGIERRVLADRRQANLQ